MTDYHQTDGTVLKNGGRENDTPCQATANGQGRHVAGPIGAARLAPSAGRTLSDQDVHIWCGWLDAPTWRVEQLERTLSGDECDRANRFRVEADRTRFIVARGVLRSILGHYLGIQASNVQFRYGAHGKPYLHQSLKQARLQFNVAHSHRLAVYAFARTREMGIDLEFARPMPHLPQTAACFMSAGELALWSELPEGQQQEAFYLCWTRKEAYIKATGMGVQQPLKQLDVSLLPGEPARLLNVEGYPGEIGRWSLHSFTPVPGYVAALAVERSDWHSTYWDA